MRRRPRWASRGIPQGEEEQKHLLRALFNIRMPRPVSEEFLQVQDAYLQEETRRKGITTLDQLEPVEDGIYLWQGDITTLSCGAIVNAANSALLAAVHAVERGEAQAGPALLRQLKHQLSTH